MGNERSMKEKWKVKGKYKENGNWKGIKLKGELKVKYKENGK